MLFTVPDPDLGGGGHPGHPLDSGAVSKNNFSDPSGLSLVLK